MSLAPNDRCLTSYRISSPIIAAAPIITVIDDCTRECNAFIESFNGWLRGAGPGPCRARILICRLSLAATTLVVRMQAAI